MRPYPFNLDAMKLYIYHLPDLETMWAFLAKDAKAAMNIVNDKPQIRAVLVRVLDGSGDGVMFPDSYALIAETPAS